MSYLQKRLSALGGDRLLLLGVGLLILLAMVLLTACAAEATPTPTPKPAATPTPAPPTPTPIPASKALTIYSGRGEALVAPLIQQFSQASGIQVKVRYGDTAALAATILEEGRNSPADVFFAQDPGGLGAVAGMMATLPDSLLNLVPQWARSPQGKWVGISGRARVVTYNTQKLKETDLPDDIYDFIDPKWKGRIGWAPTNGSFQAMVTAMRVLWGQDKTTQWLKGIQANAPKVYPNNTAIVTAVGQGEVDAGFPNHYYLYRFLQERGEAFPARNYHPRAGGPGAVILVAGAGILSTSQNQEGALRFLDFLLSQVAQQYFAGQTFEYPVVEKVLTHRLLTPLADIKNPNIDLVDLADLQGTVKLLREAGIIP